MAKDKLTDYDSTTASNNTDIGGVSIAEGMLPSNVNNSMRELTKQLGAFADGTDGVDVLKLQDDTDTNSIKLQAPSSVTANTTFTLPDGDGTADQVLKTDGSGQLGFADRHPNPSLIINGAMTIDQRNGGSSITPTDGQYSVDRWRCGLNQASKFTIQQSTVTPDDFLNSLLLTSSSAYTIGASDLFLIEQRVEGLNSSQLNWGTSSAKSITLSFWVRSSLTGTFGGSVRNSDNTRSYPFSYTISSANTFEYKSVTISGDTSGTWLTTNGVGLQITFGLGVGSSLSGTAGAWAGTAYLSATGATSLVGTSGATLYITGVKLEVGSTATDFVHRSYGEELALCQRYYEEWGGELGYQPFGYLEGTGTVGFCVLQFTEKRDAPTVTVSDPAHFHSVRSSIAFTAMSFSQPVTTHVICTISRSTNNWPSGEIFSWRANNSTAARIYFNAEL